MSLRTMLWIAAPALILAILLAAPCSAQTDASALPDTASNSNWFDHFVVKGGWITFFLLGLSVVAIALITEHFFSIRRATIVAPLVGERIRELIEKKEYVEAVKQSADDPSMLSYVVNAGLLEASNGFAAMERAVEESLEERSARFFRKIEWLNIIGNVSPMIGLFGTVFGMIKLFGSIREAGAIPEPGRIADDISIALVTTFWGLLIAIMSLSGFGWFRNRVDVLTAECALTADRLLRVFKPVASPLVGGVAGSQPGRGQAAQPSSAGSESEAQTVPAKPGVARATGP